MPSVSYFEQSYQPSKMKSKACRQLFGPVDHEEVAATTKRLKDEMNDELLRRWNFNFETMTPLTGRWDWIDETKYTVSRQQEAAAPLSASTRLCPIPSVQEPTCRPQSILGSNNGPTCYPNLSISSISSSSNDSIICDNQMASSQSSRIVIQEAAGQPAIRSSRKRQLLITSKSLRSTLLPTDFC